MIETGIARQLDAVGRITLPKELRKSLGFKDRELLEIYTEDDKIILRKCERQKQDIFTGSEEDLIVPAGIWMYALSHPAERQHRRGAGRKAAEHGPGGGRQLF